MPFQNTIITRELYEAVIDGSPWRTRGIHGLQHWQRVEMNGLYLAEAAGADKAVVSLFALFHDARRRNDGRDPRHGARGAALARQLYHRGLLPISEAQLNQLTEACRHHTDTDFSDDLTIACCWDADRLDLRRLDIRPDPALLNTPAAKTLAVEFHSD